MERVGAEEEDEGEEGVRCDLVDEVGQGVFAGGGPFFDGGEDLFELCHGVRAVNPFASVGVSRGDVGGGAVAELCVQGGTKGGDLGLDLGGGRVRKEVVGLVGVVRGWAGEEGFVAVEV